jgi:hypothetical protein
MPKDDEYGTRVNVFVMQNEIYISMPCPSQFTRTPATPTLKIRLETSDRTAT